MTRISQKFCNILVCAGLQHIYHMTKAVQGMEGPTVVGCIVVGGVLKCPLLHTVCDMKITQVNI